MHRVAPTLFLTSPTHLASRLAFGASLALCLAAAVATIPAVSAQDDGCTQASPCEWPVQVNAQGFVDPDSDPSRCFTQGDWHQLSVFNDDDVAHTVTLSGYGITLSIAPGDSAAAPAKEFSTEGDFTLSDSPSGATARITVTSLDCATLEDPATPGPAPSPTSSTSGKSRIPGFEAAIGALALVGVAAFARRPA